MNKHSVFTIAMSIAAPVSLDPKLAVTLVNGNLGISLRGAIYLPSPGKIGVNTNAGIIDIVEPVSGTFSPLSANAFSLETDGAGIYGSSACVASSCGIVQYNTAGAAQHVFTGPSGTGDYAFTIDSAGDVFGARFNGTGSDIHKWNAGTFSSPSLYATGLQFLSGMTLTTPAICSQAAGARFTK